MAKKKLDFEGSMARLEEIVGLLARGDAPLEEAMKLFEEGAKLLRECTAQLDEAEQKVTLFSQFLDDSLSLPLSLFHHFYFLVK